jgi:hypothetical protein
MHLREIVNKLPLAQSTVYQHQKEFKKADPIDGIICGPRSWYGIYREAFEKFSREFHDLFFILRKWVNTRVAKQTPS